MLEYDKKNIFLTIYNITHPFGEEARTLNNIRQEQIREHLEQNKIVTIEELTRLLPGVSVMTIHRDLNLLQEQGVLVKVRGGARYLSGDSHEPAFVAREVIHREAKQALAAKAVPLIAGSGSIFLDAGTTMTTFATLIPDEPANIVTTGPNIALELCSRSSLQISLCGGTLNKSNLTLSGLSALDYVSRLNIDTAVLVASGFSDRSGFTCGREDEARIKSQVIAQARTNILLMDTSKIERMLPHTFAQLKDFDYIVTEKNPRSLPAGLIQAAREADVQVL